jgi:hypothetical protein
MPAYALFKGRSLKASPCQQRPQPKLLEICFREEFGLKRDKGSFSRQVADPNVARPSGAWKLMQRGRQRSPEKWLRWAIGNSIVIKDATE